MDAMFVFVLIAAGMAAYSLASGITSMAHGGESEAPAANDLMFRRVAWQGLAVALVLLALLTSA